MDLKKVLREKPFITSLSLSLSSIKENPSQLSFPVLADLLFLFVHGFVVWGIILGMLQTQLVALGIELTKSSGSQYSISQLLLQEPIKPIFFRVLLLVAVLIISVYIIYCLFQGFSWWQCSKIAAQANKKSIKFISYLWEFFKINLFWLILFVFYNILALILDYMAQSETATGKGSIILNLFLVVLLYFVFISHSLLPKIRGFANIKKTIGTGILKIKHMLPAFVLMAIILFILGLILNLSSLISHVLFMIFGVIVLMPIISWMRVYLITLSNSKL